MISKLIIRVLQTGTRQMQYSSRKCLVGVLTWNVYVDDIIILEVGYNAVVIRNYGN